MIIAPNSLGASTNQSADDVSTGTTASDGNLQSGRRQNAVETSQTSNVKATGNVSASTSATKAKPAYKFPSSATSQTSNVRPEGDTSAATTAARGSANYNINSSATLAPDDWMLLQFAEATAELSRLASLVTWSDADLDALRDMVRALIAEDRITIADRRGDAYSERLWRIVAAPNARRLRWGILSVLRDINTPEALNLESRMVRSLLGSDSAGDRVAAIKSLWQRSPTEARAKLLARKAMEKNPSVLSVIEAYLSLGSYGAEVPKTAK